MSFAEACVACGVVLLPDNSKRRKRPSTLIHVCKTVLNETPLVWQQVLNIASATPETETIPLCMPCVHWLHRAEKNTQQTYLLLDRLLLFFNFPLIAEPPDARLTKRLLQALSSSITVGTTTYHNIYLRLLTDSQKSLLGQEMDYQDFIKAVITLHCRENGNNFLLCMNPVEAKRLRRYTQDTINAIFEDFVSD